MSEEKYVNGLKIVTPEWIFDSFPKINYVAMAIDGTWLCFNNRPKYNQKIGWFSRDVNPITILGSIGLTLETDCSPQNSLISRGDFDKLYPRPNLNSETEEIPKEYIGAPREITKSFGEELFDIDQKLDTKQDAYKEYYIQLNNATLELIKKHLNK